MKHCVVTTAGLDALHQTRVRVACSLLAADDIAVRLLPWNNAPSDLLVAAIDDAAGLVAFEQARRVGVPTLAISHDPTPNARFRLVIASAASVRDFSTRLYALLNGHEQVVAHAPTPATLYEHLRLDRPPVADYLLLEEGLVRLLVDTRKRRVHLLRRMPLSAIAGAADGAYWRVTALDREGFVTERAESTVTYPVEAVLWAIAHVIPADPARDHEPLQLRAWPDVDAATFPPEWLAPLSMLLWKRCYVAGLGRTAGLTEESARRLFATIRASDLVQPEGSALLEPARRAPMKNAGLFARLARRFGIRLAGDDA